MKKVLTVVISALLSCILIFAFVGCEDAANIERITDIGFYADMQRQADKIDVDYDNATQAGFKFSITDENEIEEIMDIIFSETLNDLGKQAYPPMGNTHITIYQGEKAYGMSVRFITFNNRLYAFSTSNLSDKIFELATARGAFDF